MKDARISGLSESYSLDMFPCNNAVFQSCLGIGLPYARPINSVILQSPTLTGAKLLGNGMHCTNKLQFVVIIITSLA